VTHEVIEVNALDGHQLLLTFTGGEQRRIEIRAIVPFDGVFASLKDESYFRQVRVNPDSGTIVWPNGADICPDVLYEQSVVRQRDARQPFAVKTRKN
jgi:hypothetical protein